MLYERITVFDGMQGAKQNQGNFKEKIQANTVVGPPFQIQPFEKQIRQPLRLCDYPY